MSLSQLDTMIYFALLAILFHLTVDIIGWIHYNKPINKFEDLEGF